MSKVFTAAIVGLGRIASILEDDPYREKPCTHAGVIQAHPQVKLLAGVDNDVKKRKQFQKRWNCPNLYNNFEELIKNHDLDIIHIASPTPTHFDFLEKCIKSKIPLVILEKPISSGKDAYKKSLALLKKIKSSSTQIVVNHERRFANDYCYLKKNIIKKVWGDIQSINGWVFMNPLANPSKVLLHDGTHFLDLLSYFLNDEIKSIKVFGEDKKGSIWNLFFKIKKIPIHLEIGGNKKYLHFELLFNFSKGRVFIGNGIYREEIAEKSPFYKGVNSLKVKKVPIFKKTEYFKNMYTHAISLLENPKLKNESSFKEGMLILKLLELIKKIN